MNKIKELLDNRLKAFLLFTFLISWMIPLLFIVLNQKIYMPVLVLYMFIPMTVAMILQKKVYHEPIKDLGISWKINKWWFVAWLFPVILSIATFGISLLFTDVSFSPTMEGMFERLKDVLTPEQLKQMRELKIPFNPFLLGIIQALIAGVTVNAVAAFGEEFGWRGFLLKEFSHLNLWKASLIIGLIWGVWHAPIIMQGHNYSQHPFIGVFMMIIWCILLTPIMIYIRVKSKSVMTAAIFHGSLNASYSLAIMYVIGGNDLTIGLTGLAGFIALVLFNACILFDKTIYKTPLKELM